MLIGLDKNKKFHFFETRCITAFSKSWKKKSLIRKRDLPSPPEGSLALDLTQNLKSLVPQRFSSE
jgi:hypothetical protein